MTSDELRALLPYTTLAFRGYNVTNLGRSRELLDHPIYGPTVERHLRRLSEVSSDLVHRRIDLVARVRAGEETTLDSYADALALILAMEGAQLELLRTHFGFEYQQAELAFGYSLGEIGALVASGLAKEEDAVRVPVALADDAVALAEGVTLGVFFSRADVLSEDAVQGLCIDINSGGRGVIGMSAILSPNSVLLMGQGDTLDRFMAAAKKLMAGPLHLRKNEHRWPPMHTPITWERQIPNRAASLLHTIPFRAVLPKPKVLSLVTGRFSYAHLSTRDLLQRWVDHPQRLWDAVYATLASRTTVVLHIGPGPNIIPATFKRVADNVGPQLAESFRLRALSAAARRPWLQRMLPQRAALLRAPYLKHVVLEDWLLENSPN